MAQTDKADENDRGGFSQDLERGPGPDVLNNRLSTGSALSGIGSAISSSDSSIMGDPDQQPDTGEEWGPQHPCYPHLNPHVPVDSPEYVNTRIIRIRRDWLLEGDLAPTFSNLYPEILDPAGLNEQEFRRIIEKLNGELVPTFSPYNWRNILDGVLGLATGWLWDDFGFTAAKIRLRNLEKWIEQWNSNMEKTFSADENTIPPKIVPLRRTGYMTLDIQIPDPEIAPAPPSTPGASRQGYTAEQADNVV
ncbi:Golgin subfamily A member 7/ERF4 family-domain-containing protein [Cercophora newfieldiana]|uniref:Ras modification protein ERF4 n=1 Tax=Cercophora newfieldiana TaxID=92897 RepID=A0AA40CQ02_9PEZI|nr:Golgin subfamily A member 7/ERF4 family-domain-containing protein [Cercophora newfieldiana]